MLWYNRHYTGRFQVSREDQVDQELTRWAVKKDLRKMTLTWEEAELLTDKDGVGVWPNASTWMQVESRSRSRSMYKLITVMI